MPTHLRRVDAQLESVSEPIRHKSSLIMPNKSTLYRAPHYLNKAPVFNSAPWQRARALGLNQRLQTRHLGEPRELTAAWRRTCLGYRSCDEYDP